MKGAVQAGSQRVRVLVLVLIVSILVSACLSSPSAPATPTRIVLITPAATAAATATTPPASTKALPPAPTATADTSPRLAVPTDFAQTHAAALAQLQRDQPTLRIDQVADSQAALERLQRRQATWAVVDTNLATAAARPLCITPYVPIVHFSSPLEEITSERLKAAYSGSEWPGVVLAADDAGLRRMLALDKLGSQVTLLPTWKAVVERVAGDRTALALVPWSEVDARVKTLALDGKSIAVHGLAGYDRGVGWRLSGVADATPLYNAIASALACPLKEPVTFLAAGDMLMGWFVNDIYIKKEGPEYLFRRIADLTRSADIAFANFENPLTPREVSGYLQFRASPEAVKGLTYGGIDVVNLANNHMGDAGTQGLLDTLETLSRNGIAYIGAGRNRTEARSAWITTTRGITIAMLAYNEIGREPGYFAATDSRPGTAWIEPDNVVAEIKKAKSQADFVIVSFHWGIEYTAHPNERQRDLARRAAEAGAGLIVGHHPHVVQGVGFFGPAFVNYSIGDFVYSQPTRPATGEGIILRAIIDGPTLKQVQMIPIYIDRAQPYVISPVEAKLMMARIFDATRVYNGLPASSEKIAAAPVALPAPKTAAPSGTLTAVALDGGRADIYAGNTRLTNDGAVNDAPAWSPDGKRIAFSSARDGTFDIIVAAADGSGAINVTRHPAWDDYPAWSPDGTMIAFTSNREGPFKIYVMNADGSNVRRLTSGTSWDTTPAWSPDGKRIAFASDRTGLFEFQIYTVNVDGTGLLQLTDYPRVNAFPSWSPDGKSLVYQSYQDESMNQDNDAIQDRDYEIMLISAAGGKPRRLTDNTFADIHPAWSPDGSRIAFASDRSGTFQIYLMNADGSNVVSATSGMLPFVSPTWAP